MVPMGHMVPKYVMEMDRVVDGSLGTLPGEDSRDKTGEFLIF